MKLVASDGVLLSHEAPARRLGHANVSVPLRPAREKMFLVEAGSYVRRTANHRDDPMLCELCGSVTEAFQAQQVRVELFGHSAEVMKWKNDGVGHHLRAAGGSTRFCHSHNQRNPGSQYRSAFRVSGEANKWRSALAADGRRPELTILDASRRDMALALSSPRIGERMIGERLTLLAEAARRRPSFLAEAWRTFSGLDEDQPAELDGADYIEFTLRHPYDERAYGQVAKGRYRFNAGPRLYDRCLRTFPRRSPVSKFLSWRSDTAMTTRSGMVEGVLSLPGWMRQFFDQNPSMGSYADFVSEVARECRECRELALWVPSVRAWIIFDSIRNKSWFEVSGDPFSPLTRSQSVTVMFERVEQWNWALKALWGKVKPGYDPSLDFYVLPQDFDAF